MKNTKDGLPKGKMFSNRFIYSLICLAGLIVIGGLYVFLSTSSATFYPRGAEEKNLTSEMANQKIISINAQGYQALSHGNAKVAISQGNYTVNQNVASGQYQVGQFVMKDGKLYRVGADGKLHLYNGKLKEGDIVLKGAKPYIFGKDGKLHPLHDGEIVSINGKPYMWKNGKLVPLDEAKSPYKEGQFVIKDGKLYRVGADGKLHPYHGKLKEGDIVWKDGKPYIVGKDGKLHPLHDGEIVSVNGKPYVWKNGKLVPLSDLGAQVGDLIEKDGKLYQLGKDGKLHLYKGKPKVGQTLWKDAKAYYIDADGKPHLLQDGTISWDKNGQVYISENGTLKPYHKACVPVKINNQYYVTNKQGKLHRFEEGDQCVDEKGNKVILSDHQIIKIKSSKNQKDAYEDLWKTTAKNADKDIMGAAIRQYHPEDNNQAEAKPTDKLRGYDQQTEGMANLNTSSNGYAQQNGQSEKLAFMKNAKALQKESLDSRTVKNNYPYSITAGSVIPATLETGINSDLPGMIIARVSKNVYDTRTGKYLLIPQGTVITGVYDSGVTYGQSRVLMAWNRLEFPNGNNYDLNGMAGADLSGYSGLHDKVDNHYFRIFGSALLFSIFGAASQITQPQSNSDSGTTNQEIIYGAIGQQMTQVSSKMIEKNMDIQPTIEIRMGDNFNILVSRTMIFDQPYQFDQ